MKSLFIVSVLTPVYLYALIGLGVISFTLLNLIGVMLISGLSLSVLIALTALSKGVK